MSGGTTPLRAVRVEPELWDKARTKAKKDGVSLSVIIRDALRVYIEESEPIQISDEALAAAACGLARQAWGEWEYVPDELRRLFLRDARVALDAAAPHMLAEAWDAGYATGECDVANDVENETTNPYRSQA